MHLILILVLAGVVAYFAQHWVFRKRPARKPPDLSGWIQVLSASHEVLMVGRRIAAVPRLGDGAMAAWGAIVVDQVDPQLIADIASVTQPIYLDGKHLFAKILVAADEGETMIVAELTDAAVIAKLEAAIAAHAATVDLRLQVASESVGLMRDADAQAGFDAVWKQYVH
jgi:phosphohistidine swiveling domain-containing protein